MWREEGGESSFLSPGAFNRELREAAGSLAWWFGCVNSIKLSRLNSALCNILKGFVTESLHVVQSEESFSTRNWYISRRICNEYQISVLANDNSGLQHTCVEFDQCVHSFVKMIRFA